ncbi:hypothetical protein NL676_035151 [Syzygium grande]|nr:hypothetical protein NL676_035151 [Syzygium grande]
MVLLFQRESMHQLLNKKAKVNPVSQLLLLLLQLNLKKRPGVAGGGSRPIPRRDLDGSRPTSRKGLGRPRPIDRHGSDSGGRTLTALRRDRGAGWGVSVAKSDDRRRPLAAARPAKARPKRRSPVSRSAVEGGTSGEPRGTRGSGYDPGRQVGS